MYFCVRNRLRGPTKEERWNEVVGRQQLSREASDSGTRKGKRCKKRAKESGSTRNSTEENYLNMTERPVGSEKKKNISKGNDDCEDGENQEATPLQNKPRKQVLRNRRHELELVEEFEGKGDVFPTASFGQMSESPGEGVSVITSIGYD